MNEKTGLSAVCNLSRGGKDNDIRRGQQEKEITQEKGRPERGGEAAGGSLHLSGRGERGGGESGKQGTVSAQTELKGAVTIRKNTIEMKGEY